MGDLDENWTFGDLRADTESAAAWLTSMGLRTSAGRVGRLVSDLRDLQQAAESGEMGKWAQNEEFRAAMFTLIEAADLKRVHRAFEDYSGPQLPRRLRRALKGPRAGAPESPKNNAARNYLAELSFAAMLRLNSYNVDLEHRPDIVLRIPLLGEPQDAALAWEVKRPLSAAAVERRLREGAKQVQRAVREGLGGGSIEVVAGTVVLVLDHVIPPFFSVPHPTGDLLRASMKARLAQWVEENYDLLLSCMLDGIAGVCMFWRPIGRLTTAQGQLPIEGRELYFFGRSSRVPAYTDSTARLITHMKP